MSKRWIMKPTALALAITVALSGCATVNKTLSDNSEKMACGIGAVAGGVIVGGLVAIGGGSTDQILIGVATGGLAGCAAVYFYKKRVDRLEAVAKQQGLDAQINEIKMVDASGKTEAVGVQAQVQLEEMFPSGSSKLTVDGTNKLSALAKEFAAERVKARTGSTAGKDEKVALPTKVLVVGHTDSTGSADLNQRLSEERARAVAGILASAGIQKSDIYFQGAGSSRPVADNTSTAGRAKNRRVEFVEVTNEAILVQRVNEERSNSKYLSQGTATENKVKVASAPAKSQSKPSVKPQPPVAAPKTPGQVAKAPELPATPSQPFVVALNGKGGIDFGGVRVNSTESVLASSIAPKTPTFSIISPAYASAPVSSCIGDMPRTEGEVKNLATGKALKDFSTTEFFPGLNGRVWASKLNGHVATVGPVGVLRDNAKVAVEPNMQFISNYAGANKKQTPLYKSVANTYEGETQVLYRVFALDTKNAPVSCMDLVFDKRAGTAVAGEIYYPNEGDAYVAQFKPSIR